MLNVPPSGLKPFFARGGRLLLSHGWNDGLIPANNTLEFHKAVFAALPARQLQDQLRLFMVPGMAHCSGGEGPSAIDTLATLDTWTPSGRAPDRLIANSLPGKPAISRPLCTFPQTAHYEGDGSITKETSFSCALPPAR